MFNDQCSMLNERTFQKRGSFAINNQTLNIDY